MIQSYETTQNSFVNVFENVCSDVIKIIITFLSLSDMLRLGRSCKMFHKAITVHPTYNCYLQYVNSPQVIGLEEFKRILKFRIAVGTFLKLRDCDVVNICYQTNDLILLKYHFRRSVKNMTAHYIMYNISKFFDISIVDELLHDVLDDITSTVYEYGCIGATMAKREDLVDYFLKKGVKIRVSLLTAAYSGNVTFIKRLVVIGDMRDVILEMFEIGIISGQIDVIKMIVNELAISLWELKMYIKYRNLFIMGNEGTRIIDYLVSINLISMNEAVKWVLRRNDFKYLESILHHFVIDWYKQCLMIVDDYLQPIENRQRAFLFAVKRTSDVWWGASIFMKPIFEEGLEYFVKERKRTWDYLFVKCCKKRQLEAAKFCFRKICVDNEEATLLMGLDKISEDCVELKKWIFDSLDELRKVHPKRKAQKRDYRNSSKIYHFV